jgi:UDP-glucose 4-epimerase
MTEYPKGVRVVVVGATGNVGTSVVEVLSTHDRVGSIVGLARRRPQWEPEKTDWASVDIDRDDLTEHFRGADVVVHLAWLFQPTHNPVTTWRTNVLGGIRVFQAAASAEVPALVYASSVGAYSPGPKNRLVDEDWPTHGWPEAAYCREKAYLERYLDAFALDHPGMRVVRMRPAFLFKREAASEQRRLFAGPLVPNRLVRPGRVPVIPDVPGLRFQAAHTADVADAYVEAVLRPVHGAFNLAAEPVVDADMLADLLGAKTVPVPRRPVHWAVSGAWRLHLVPASPQLVDAVLRLPLMDSSRARDELGWSPRFSSREALEAFLEGLRESGGMATAPLAARAPRSGRLREFATGVGRRA